MSSERYQPFPNTHWSLVRRAGRAEGHGQREALAVLLTRYEPALKFYLRSVRRLGDEADDVLQAFVADKVLEREMLRHAEEGRGRFRTFLLTSLNNYVASLYRAGSTSRKLFTDEKTPNIDLDAIDAPTRGSIAPSGSEVVEAAWARALVRDVLAAMKAKCQADGRFDVWRVFEGRVLAEAVDDSLPVPYEILARELGLKSPTQAANLLVTAKRLYARLLRIAVSEYERGEGDIEAELAELRAILRRAPHADRAAGEA